MTASLVPAPSSRLRFRQWTADDVPLAYQLWGDAEVTRFFGGPMTLPQAKDRLQLELDRQERFGIQYWPMFLREGGEFAGCAGLRPWREDESVREAGVHLARSAWGHRLGEEAVRAVIAHGFDTLGLRAITAGHGQGHTNSKALLGRLGFRYTHDELWSSAQLLCSFYQLDRENFSAEGCGVH
jgi:ribosomal-protein-alanine N-acetyltransferase